MYVGTYEASKSVLNEENWRNRLKFHLARLDSTRLDTFDFVEPVEQVETSVSSETSRALPTWRTTNDLVQV